MLLLSICVILALVFAVLAKDPGPFGFKEFVMFMTKVGGMAFLFYYLVLLIRFVMGLPPPMLGR